MKVHQTKQLKLSASVVAIGAFDGIHLGHQAVIRELVKKSHLEGVPSVVYTFYPPPRSYFQGAKILTKPRKKIELIQNLGVDQLVLAEFNEKYLQRTAENFVNELFLLNPKVILVGDDFRFGYKRIGDVQLLKKYFTVQSVEPIYCINGEKISSTKIRELMEQGEYKQVDSLLGRYNEAIKA
ncbi:riboflavin kinase/FMN adenylyltransferase [Evansella vedderi]|uniref:FAD synthase n=1 Tax=Evansella vedderi TaxID=38282 RepID=A0ABU0A0Z5_9BACI|nr:FAD synthetase [Evansella vedderi]MDQ0257161.1 riboflavin kinase/FMN adenylyltransferase [Evansella vedderi]